MSTKQDQRPTFTWTGHNYVEMRHALGEDWRGSTNGVGGGALLWVARPDGPTALFVAPVTLIRTSNGWAAKPA